MKLLLTGAVALLAFWGRPADAASILVLNGSGSNTVAAPLTAAGFNVISAAFNPGVIATNLSAHSDIEQIWVWNDGTYGNTNFPENPARAFNAADQAALLTFNTAHSHWIMDVLAWRGNGNTAQQHFTKNEALNLSAAGGGIVLGTDDASGAAIVQHVNQVTALFNFDPFAGVYTTPAGTQQLGGTLFSDPNPVDPTGIVGSGTYAEAPNGLQPNGLFLGTALFGQGTPFSPWSTVPLPGQEFNGEFFANVNHMVTTTIQGASIDPIPNPVPEPSTLLLLGTGLAFCLIGKVRRGAAR